MSATAGTGSTVLVGIGSLVTNEPSLGPGPTGEVRDGALLIDGDGRIAFAGTRAKLPEQSGDALVDLGGRAVVPGFVDAHTHVVFDGDRVQEFEARMAGLPYDAGGIASTVAATRRASDGVLRARAGALVAEALRSGTTTIEIKSGYGLSVEDEARSLAVAAELTSETTFLGAHVVPGEFAHRREEYLALVTGEMLTRCAPDARFVDVFCERGAFDPDESRAVLEAGAAAGLLGRIHANQLGDSGGVRLGTELGLASCDHCTHLSDADVERLAARSATTVATLVPAAEFLTRSPYAPARALLDAGALVALATDANPGSSYTTSMPFVIALAVRELAMTCDEAIWAATAGGARSLRRDDVGRLAEGCAADLVVLEAPSHRHLAYRAGVDLVSAVVRAGTLVSGRWPGGA